MLASISFAGITPFAPDDAPDRLRLHRIRPSWQIEVCNEGSQAWLLTDHQLRRDGPIIAP